jgi:hypothetical protein
VLTVDGDMLHTDIKPTARMKFDDEKNSTELKEISKEAYPIGIFIGP